MLELAESSDSLDSGSDIAQMRPRPSKVRRLAQVDLSSVPQSPDGLPSFMDGSSPSGPRTTNSQAGPGGSLRHSFLPSPASPQCLCSNLAHLGCPTFPASPSAHWPQAACHTCHHKNPVLMSLDQFDS